MSCYPPLPCRYIEFELLSDISETWDSLLPDSHHLRSEHLQVLEHCRPSDIGFRYLLVMKEDKTVGVIYLQQLHFNSRHYNTSALDKPAFKLVKPFVMKQAIDLLVCGNLFRIDFQGYYFKNKQDEKLIFDILEDYARQNQNGISFCGILLKDCEEPVPSHLLQLSRFKPFRDDITMELRLPEQWNTFDHYLSSLSRKYLQRAKKILKAAESCSKRELDLESIEAYRQDIEALYLEVAEKQSIRMGILNGGYFTEMKKTLGDRFKLTGYFSGDKMIAFNSMIFYEQHMEIHYIGLNYSFNNEYKLYFNILFDGIKEAIAHSYSRLELGRTAREAKASAGAAAVEIHNYIRVKRGLPSLAFSFFTHFFNRNLGDEWKQRNPFKDNTGQAI